MPHISVKMLEGRSTEQKEKLAKALKETLVTNLKCPEKYVSVSVQDYSAKEWQSEFENEVTNNIENILVEPCYDPKELL